MTFKVEMPVSSTAKKCGAAGVFAEQKY